LDSRVHLNYLTALQILRKSTQVIAKLCEKKDKHTENIRWTFKARISMMDGQIHVKFGMAGAPPWGNTVQILLNYRCIKTGSCIIRTSLLCTRTDYTWHTIMYLDIQCTYIVICCNSVRFACSACSFNKWVPSVVSAPSHDLLCLPLDCMQ